MSRASGRVSDGTRTRDRLDHNQELYQLSYAHQAEPESSSGSRPRRAVRCPYATSASFVCSTSASELCVFFQSSLTSPSELRIAQLATSASLYSKPFGI
jgi:hypothetical protein